MQRLVFVGPILGFVLGAAGWACEDGDAASSTAPDAGTPNGEVAAGVCPTDAPRAGDPCLLPEGTTCAFGACGTPIATCFLGSWVYGGNPPPRPPCPTEPPTPETACPACWQTTDSCSYGSEDCSAADASTNRATATCPSGTWVIEFVPCANADDAGDAGTDVQGDAGGDAD